MIRQLIREMLLTEKVYGAQAVVYHGSNTEPEVFIPAILNDTFDPGHGSGAMYGKGLYCVYDLAKTQTGSGKYGDYVYKFKVNLYGFICFDPEVALLVYKRPLTPVEQAQELGLDETLIEKLKGTRIRDGFTSAAALHASKFLKGKVKGLIFTGAHDGRVAVVYDDAVAIPFAWKLFNRRSWNSVDKSSLKPAIRKSSLGGWEVDKYEIKTLLAKLSKLPANERMFKGNLDFNGAKITSLPDNLKIGGSLNLGGSSVTSLPADLHVGGTINLSYAKITSLPAGLQVGVDLDLRGSSITSLPADLKVGRDLYGPGPSITSLPAGLKVGRDLNLGGISMTSLPAGLKVGRDLDLYGSSVTSLPADLKVGGNLNLRTTPGITSLPDGLKVGGTIHGFKGDKSQVPLYLMDKVK